MKLNRIVYHYSIIITKPNYILIKNSTSKFWRTFDHCLTLYENAWIGEIVLWYHIMKTRVVVSVRFTMIDRSLFLFFCVSQLTNGSTSNHFVLCAHMYFIGSDMWYKTKAICIQITEFQDICEFASHYGIEFSLMVFINSNDPFLMLFWACAYSVVFLIE